MTSLPSTEAPPAAHSWLRLWRLHHWLKNLLLAVPCLMAQAGSRQAALAALGLGFVAFSLLASANCVFNDPADVAHDREHAAQRHRPLAAGAIGAGPALLVAALAPL